MAIRLGRLAAGHVRPPRRRLHPSHLRGLGDGQLDGLAHTPTVAAPRCTRQPRIGRSPTPRPELICHPDRMLKGWHLLTLGCCAAVIIGTVALIMLLLRRRR